MNYGLYLAAGGALHNLMRQDILANNLANANTTGFKPDTIYGRFRLPERLERPAISVPPHEMLERLGGGVAGQRAAVSTKQGHLMATNQPLDVAIEGPGYFVVSDPRNAHAKGAAAGSDTLMTRDGRFSLNQHGEVVTAANGLRVLDSAGRPIRLTSDAPVTIDGEGTVIQDDRIIATLQLAVPRNPALLRKEGENLLRLPGGAAAKHAATGRVVQGHIEASAVDPIMTLNDLINATKAAQANLRMMQYHDHIMGQAINTLGRVA